MSVSISISHLAPFCKLSAFEMILRLIYDDIIFGSILFLNPSDTEYIWSI